MIRTHSFVLETVSKPRYFDIFGQDKRDEVTK